MEVKRGRVHPTHSERAHCCYDRSLTIQKSLINIWIFTNKIVSFVFWFFPQLFSGIRCRVSWLPKLPQIQETQQEKSAGPTFSLNRWSLLLSLLILSGPQFTIIQCLFHAAAISLVISANITINFVRQKWRTKSIGGVQGGTIRAQRGGTIMTIGTQSVGCFLRLLHNHMGACNITTSLVQQHGIVSVFLNGCFVLWYFLSPSTKPKTTQEGYVSP